MYYIYDTEGNCYGQFPSYKAAANQMCLGGWMANYKIVKK